MLSIATSRAVAPSLSINRPPPSGLALVPYVSGVLTAEARAPDQQIFPPGQTHLESRNAGQRSVDLFNGHWGSGHLQMRHAGYVGLTTTPRASGRYRGPHSNGPAPPRTLPAPQDPR